MAADTAGCELGCRSGFDWGMNRMDNGKYSWREAVNRDLNGNRLPAFWVDSENVCNPTQLRTNRLNGFLCRTASARDFTGQGDATEIFVI